MEKKGDATDAPCPYLMIIDALQTVLNLYKNYLSDVQLPCIK